MSKSNELEKSKGVVLFAFNSEKVNYVKIADLTSKLINQNLKLPITLITDEESVPKFDYDRIITFTPKTGNYRKDKKNNLIEWRNFDRCSVFDLSPYDETLLLDTDYLVLDNSLLKLFDQPFDYRLMYKMQTPAGVSDEEMGPSSLPLIWATVVLFRKTHRTKLFFNLIKRIQQNYTYYKNLYSMRDTNYRNDHAFSIANIILNGYALDEHTSIPWPMLTVKEDVKSLSIENSLLIIKNHLTAIVTAKQDLHIMDKEYLLSEQFKNFVDKVCNE
jgi:hypothetical protein